MTASDWILIAIALLVVGGIVVALIMSARLRAGAALAAANMIDQWHKQDVTRKRTQIDELKRDAANNEAEINRLKDELAAKRERLRRKYKYEGATADEVMDRLDRLGL